MIRHGARIFFLLILALGSPAWSQKAGVNAREKNGEKSMVQLQAPRFDGSISVEKAIQGRRSVRDFSGEALTLAELSQVLWAAYGITDPHPDGPAFLRGGLRAAPSAGGLYPLEIYVVAGQVTGLAAGIYRYVSERHALLPVRNGDWRQDLCFAAIGQGWIRQAPAAIVYTAVFERTTRKYGQRGRDRYVCMDAGHSSENVYLQAQALGLGCCMAGAFNDEGVKKVMNMPAAEEPLCILAVGKPK